MLLAVSRMINIGISHSWGMSNFSFIALDKEALVG